MDANVSEKILRAVQRRGPVLPAQLTKEAQVSLTFAGAFLSQLVSSGKLFMSNKRIGSSPVYYIKGQETKLQNVLYPHLNPKDQQTFNILKEKKLLKDQDLTPFQKASLNNLKDFAIPLTIKLNGNAHKFWKWYMLPNDDIGKFLQQQQTFTEEPSLSVEQPKKEIKPVQPVKELTPKQPKEEVKEEKKKQFEDELKKYEDILSKLEKEKLGLEKERKKIEEERKKIEKLHEAKPKPQLEKEVEDKQEKLVEAKPKPTVKGINDPFLTQIKTFFNKKDIEIKEFEIIRKKSEIDLIISVPSAVGKVEYYCKAKKKKRCNEGDLSAAFVKGQTKKLPVVFLTPGELTKRASEQLSTDFKNIIFQKFG